MQYEKIKAKRVKKDEVGVRKLGLTSCVNMQYPQDGILLKITTESTDTLIYISDDDLEKLISLDGDWVNLAEWNSKKE